MYWAWDITTSEYLLQHRINRRPLNGDIRGQARGRHGLTRRKLANKSHTDILVLATQLVSNGCGQVL